MKKILFLSVAISLFSCGVPVYYQVYKAKSESPTATGKQIVFEDSNIKVSYDLFDAGGDIGFNVYNKTDDVLIVDLSNTFFVLNGFTFDYFKDRSFSNSASTGTVLTSYGYPYYRAVTNVANSNSSSSSISYKEKPKRSILPGTSIRIAEYHISSTRYINCDLPKYPRRSRVKTLTFDKTNSPYVFYNLITYSSNGTVSHLQNNFYVSEITNYPVNMMFDRVTKSECGSILPRPIMVFKDSAPDRFYFQYLMK